MTTCRWLVVVILFCVVTVAQTSPAKPANPPKTAAKAAPKDAAVSDPWLERANLFSGELEQDIAGLDPFEAAIVNAMCARSWWKSDPVRSRQILDRVIQFVTAVPANEAEEDRHWRMVAGYAVLRIAMSMISGEEAKRIGEELMKGNTDPVQKQRAKQREQSAYRSAISRELNVGDPQVAANIMLQGLKQGLGLNQGDVMRLRGRNPKLANDVFREALKSLPALNYDSLTVWCLIEDSFPGEEGVPSAPEELKSALLQLVSQAVLRVAQGEEDKANICRNAELVMQRLAGKFSLQEWSAMQAVADGCAAKKSDAENRRAAGSKPAVDCNGVGAQECLRLAEAASTPEERRELRMSALTAAFNERNSELTISIYKSWSDEERQGDTQTPLLLLDAYVDIEEKYLKNNDRSSFYKLLSDAPEEVLPNVQLWFADEMLKKGPSPDGLALLSDARTALSKHGAPAMFLYLELLNEYAEFVPADAPAVLRECIEGLNRMSAAKDLINHCPWGLSSSLVDLDTTFLSQSAQSLKEPESRVCFEIGLVRAALKRSQETSKQVAPKSSPPK